MDPYAFSNVFNDKYLVLLDSYAPGKVGAALLAKVGAEHAALYLLSFFEALACANFHRNTGPNLSQHCKLQQSKT